ncbi:1-hydroxycarotenoid 3,4-desaturase CrtD [Litorisediminicola beolgyonensis]|uniref:1-hydroxycarotenoid 3,4-desaturase CrtD n=1 Tax=Litorisediminicola beolgyonensis TaxID=1173614 RepID=A0ABW3ZDV8_9RHOB
MNADSSLSNGLPDIVIGAGIGGLATALRLASAGRRVCVLDKEPRPGGKVREIGGVAAGPTVLTLRWVFDELFAESGARLGDHVTLRPLPCLARHFWTDGSQLDLFADESQSAEAIRAFAGPKAEREFLSFTARARRLFEGFLDPMMRAPVPRATTLAAHVIRHPRLIRDMAPANTLDALLKDSFTDPRLRQLFGRYATYVGGSPYRSPALLALIWQAEAAGVWAIDGGIAALAKALAERIQALGGEVRLSTPVSEIETRSGRAQAVRLSDGTRIAARSVTFNGDPRALALGLLGPDAQAALPKAILRIERSLSAEVWSFRARIGGPELSHHNVFFRDDPCPEFEALAAGKTAPDPTLYLCAQDRLPGRPLPDQDRIQIIANASPLAQEPPTPEEDPPCPTRIFSTLTRFGTTFSPEPDGTARQTAPDFEVLSPGSAGSLYGQSPHGMMAAFQRPTARTAIDGLYLAGGGTHPGAGVPMAALSGQHAAAAILTDRASTSRSRRTATPGGISTASATMAAAPSRSSPS